MAVKEFYVGSVGPLLYDDTKLYPDAAPFEGARFSQIYIEDEPLEDYHVARLIDIPTMFIGGLFLNKRQDSGATVTILSDDDCVYFTRNSATPTVATLPSATGTGKLYMLKVVGTANVILTAQLTETIDGESTQTLYQWESKLIQDVAAGIWYLIG